MEEAWKAIVDHRGYQVSNLGRIKRLARITMRNGYPMYWKELIKKPSLGGNGYLTTTFCENGKMSNVKLIHRLIAQAFISNPQGYPDVNHKNSITTDNRIENLEWVSTRENITHGFRRKNKSRNATGVAFERDRNLWVARIRIDGKRQYLGRYATEEDAGLAYKRALDGNSIVNKYAV